MILRNIYILKNKILTVRSVYRSVLELIRNLEMVTRLNLFLFVISMRYTLDSRIKRFAEYDLNL